MLLKRLLKRLERGIQAFRGELRESFTASQAP